MLIKSYSKKNKLLDNVKKEIKELDGMCISPEEKEMRIEELKQLNKSIAYTSTMIQFFWKEDTMVSYVRDQHYTIVDMLGIIIANQYMYPLLAEMFFFFPLTRLKYEILLSRKSAEVHCNLLKLTAMNRVLFIDL